MPAVTSRANEQCNFAWIWAVTLRAFSLTWPASMQTYWNKLTISSCVSVRMSRYWPSGKFGEHERGVSNCAQTDANNSQHCCVKNVGSCCVRVGSCLQHVTSNNVGSCWSTMLLPFARSLRVPLFKTSIYISYYPPRPFAYFLISGYLLQTPDNSNFFRFS